MLQIEMIFYQLCGVIDDATKRLSIEAVFYNRRFVMMFSKCIENAVWYRFNENSSTQQLCLFSSVILKANVNCKAHC